MIRRFGLMCGFLTVALILAATPDRAQAKSVVVANFSGKSKRLAKRARQAIVRALSAKGFKLVSYGQYLRKAKRARISKRRALRAKSIRKMASRMKLDGVVTGSVRKKGRRYIITVKVFNRNGKLKLKKAYRVKRQSFPRATARKLARLINAKIGGRKAVAAAPPPEPPPDPAYEETGDEEETGSGSGLEAEDPETAAAPAETETKTGDAFLPKWAREDKSTASSGSGEASGEEEEEEEAPPTTRKRAPSRRVKAGSVPDLLIAAGMGLNTRAGMDPRHESGVFPSFRVDGHFFLGAFMDMEWVEGIGLGGSFNRSFMLQYGPERSDSRWDSVQQQWYAEALYRLALNDVAMKPAFIVHLGYGATTCEIDTTERLAVSVAYTYPFGGLEIYLTLYEDMVRLNAGASYLFAVNASGEVTGDGSGFSVQAGLDLELFSPIQLSIGYELIQVEFDGQVHDYDPTTVSDTYQSFYARAGYRFH